MVGFKAEMLLEKGMVEKGCLSDGDKQAEGERRGGGQEHWGAISSHLPPLTGHLATELKNPLRSRVPHETITFQAQEILGKHFKSKSYHSNILATLE